MTDIATLGLEVETTPLVRARDELGRFVKGASAAETAARRWGMTTSASARQAEVAVVSSSRAMTASVGSVGRARDEMGRFIKTNSDVARASMVTYAGMSRASMATYAGMTKNVKDFDFITAYSAAHLLNTNKASGESFSSLTKNVTDGSNRMVGAMRVAEDVGRGLGTAIMAPVRALGPLAAALSVGAVLWRAWAAGMKAADLGEQSAQLNLSAEALQAYRFEAAQNGIGVGQLDQAMIRLTATLGTASKGGEEQIKMFDRLGVKILDANGELRGTEELLPEIARGLLAVGSETQRNALLTEMFGRSGARMVTMLQSWASGNETLIASAKKQGGVLEAEVIAAWDKLSDQLVRTGLAADNALARIGAPVATWALEKVETLLKSIVGNLDRIKNLEATTASRAVAADITVLEERLKALDSNPTQFGAAASRKALEAQIAAARARQEEAKAQERQVGMAADEEYARSVKLPPMTPPPTQAIPKSSGGAKENPYDKMIEASRSYISAKKAETDALGLSVEAAARMTHEQAMLNRAAEAGIKLTTAQAAAIRQMATDMAAADAAFANSEFMKNAQRDADGFIRDKEIERQAIGMTAEAAARLRYEQSMLNEAQARGIVLTQQQREEIGRLASDMAGAEEKTRQAKESFEFTKSVAKGFFSDINQGIREGANVWDIFANAGMNALQKISDKLMDMAMDKLFESALGGAGGSGGGGGFLGGILNFVGGLFGGFAKGGVFDKSGLVKFANGGIIDRPTLFPFAKGAGLMGEAGPEAIMPLRRMNNGALGVASTGNRARGNGGEITVRVLLEDDMLNVKIDNRSTAVVKRHAPAIEASAIEKSGRQVIPIINRDKNEGHGDHRV